MDGFGTDLQYLLNQDLNFIFHKFSFVKSNLKNKTFISFCINLLIGLLFSFPVFSAQSNVVSVNISKSECSVIENECGFKGSSENISNSDISFPKDKEIKTSQAKLTKKNYIPGNKDNSKSNSSPPGFREQFNIELLNNCLYSNPDHVNLTYLKDLRTTKMLC